MFLAAAVSGRAADAPDYSKEAAVIQNIATTVSFSMDGAREWRQTLAVRVQSEAAVRQFGVLPFSYSSDSEQFEIEYVRVRKPDGTIVETPKSSVMDVATQVAILAPTYSDLRQKQIPVKALGVGDVLEYSVRSSQHKPEVPGQFWYEQTFIGNSVVLNQSLELRVPKNQYIQVSSPNLKSEIREDGNERVYLWTHAQLQPSKPEAKKKHGAQEDEPLKIRVTTFKNWAEVGDWWGALAAVQAVVTPAIQAKAKELTAGLSTDTDKAKAIYAYVATKFRYISISFGAGRYRPHSAEEVLTNQYGDCKDKHTLLAALLKAAGIQAWPALIGAGIKLDPSLPTPTQFNHVITVLPRDGKYVWLDTTAEVAPFGFLGQILRDEQALVIPSAGTPVLMRTPVDPPFAASETVDIESSLALNGTLTGHLDFRMRGGDDAVAMRAGFHELAPTQWPVFIQGMSFALGYAGDVSGVNAESLDDLDKPLHYGYDYTRKDFSDWAERKIQPPMPPLIFGPGDEAEKPRESFWAGVPGETVCRASVRLPKGFSVVPPRDAALTSDFADYSAHYSIKDGVLLAERKMIVKKPKVTVEQWEEYRKFYKAVRSDQDQFLTLSEGQAAASSGNPEAQGLVYRAWQSLQAHDLNAARDLLAQAERLNPEQADLWSTYADVEMSSGNEDQAISDVQKEIEYHPNNRAYVALSLWLIRAGRLDDAVGMWRSALLKKPGDGFIAWHTASVMMLAKRYADIPAVLEKSIAAAPGRYDLQVFRAEAWLRGGEKDRGIEEARKIAKAMSDPNLLNNLSFMLSDTDANIELARELAERAVNQTEQECAKAALASLDQSGLARVNSLVAEWDTLGWAYFKGGETAKAEKYLDASWQLGQHSAVADHLGEIYYKQGRRDAAIHMWRLALASNSSQESAREHLRLAGATVAAPVPVKPRQPLTGAVKRTGLYQVPSLAVSPAEELGKLRTTGIPALPKQTGSAEFYLLVSQDGIQDVQFIGGSDSLKNAAREIRASKYKFPFPDAGPEKIVRRAILSCSYYTAPSCQLTLLLPSTVRKDNNPN